MNKINSKSLGARIFSYVLIFAIVLLAIIWVLQTVLVNTQYEQMKVEVVHELASNIEETLTKTGDVRNLDRMIRNYAQSEDCHVAIETPTETVAFSPNAHDAENMQTFPFSRQLESVRNELKNSHQESISIKTDEGRGDLKTLAYAKVIDIGGTPAILYIFSPLYPVTSTIAIIRTQLIYITIIALVASALIAFFISRKVSKPIEAITETATNLGTGNYNITFMEGGYSEIDNLSKTLNTVANELQKTEEYRNDLMANVSHDLKTPLTMIQSYAEMIRDLSGDNKEKREAHLQVIIDETHRLNQLVTDMLNVTRLHSGKIELDQKEFSFNECLNSVLSTYKILCEQEGYQIDYNDPKSQYIVYGDEDRIKQVITNLINNAVKYGGEDKYIKVSVKRKNEFLHFEVTDHGAGIKPEEINHVWDRYYKTSANHARNTEGSGLGLSICKEILTLHGMSFGVKSRVGKGSTFWFDVNLKKIIIPN